MDSLFNLRVFCKAAQTCSFSKAADLLDISTASVSKHIQALEQRLQVRLFHRNTRAVSLTEQGEIYYARCVSVLTQLDEAEHEIGSLQSEPQGVLKVVAPLWFASSRFAEWLTAYRSRYPKVQLLLDLKNREQEHFNDADEIALRVSNVVEDSLIARPICHIPFYFTASPDYLSRHPAPLTLDDLSDHDGLLPSYTPLKGIRQFYQIQPHQWLKPTVRSSSTPMLHELALAGQGIAFLPEWMVAHDIANGRLHPLLSHYPSYALPLYAVYQNRTYQSPKIRSFIDFLVEVGSR